MKKVIISLLSVLVGVVAGVTAAERIASKNIENVKALSSKHLALFLMMNQWIKVRQEGKSLVGYFKEKGYKKIAIYGMSYVGETLIDELKDTDVQVVYGIDKKADSIYTDTNVVTMEDDLAEVDAIVVTAITFFDEIQAKLMNKINCPVISLEDILYEI